MPKKHTFCAEETVIHSMQERAVAEVQYAY